MLAFAGDGGTADVGFQSLSGAAERGEQMIYICVDNEGYMNTGVQRSSTTPYGAWTSTTPVGSVLRGKTRDAKPMPLIMVMHNCEYVATASTAFMEDYYAKVEKAIEAAKKGMAYIHVFSPCPTGWRFPPGKLIEVARKAVKTNMVPLWEYEYKEGRIRFTHPVDNPLPVQVYLSLIGKYKHLDEKQIAYIQEQTNRKIGVLKNFAREEKERTSPKRRVTEIICRVTICSLFSTHGEVQKRTAECRTTNNERRRRQSKALNFIIRNSLVASGAAEGGQTLFEIRFGLPWRDILCTM